MSGLRLRQVLICCLCLLVLDQSALAARLDNLFQADAPASGRDPAARQAALKQALATVLVRITGDATLANNGQARTLLREPGRFVAQYRFNETPARKPGAAPELHLWAQFDEVALTRALRDLGLPYWGRDRPDVLVWLAVDDGGKRFLVSDTSRNSLADTLHDAAQQSGLPVSLPLLDLQDQRAVSFSDLWGGFLGPVQKASERYRPQVVLVGRVDRSRSGWNGQWTLLGAGASHNWTVHGVSAEDTVQKGLSESTSLLASRYAVVASDQGSRQVSVQGIDRLEDFARVQGYLSSLSPVEQVQVAMVKGDEVQFSLQLSTSEQSLVRLIRLGHVLEPLSTGADALWQFRLIR
ncbi:hypothetical protein DFR30_1084 [Thiogranum longum]|uniref:DUF2066 domain-containing protein n=1 Tax=Thiogranum longum TaxID=1537524 RepID=A0A4R1H7N0_9GAMM|nr:DUF2066 domain-containing protein [Thiogranum longum]TCK17834.1 hypothetical protein DFR30_1084 [Thiogranum longum]